MNITMVKTLFIIAAIYDGILGLLFVFFPGFAFELFEVLPPNHFGYVQFPAILLLIFAAMFYRVALDPLANRFIMVYGMALKIGYSGTVFYYMLTTGVPAMWIPWAWADLVFLVLFILAWQYTGKIVAASSAES
jgi:hypothetical protein